MKNRVFKKIIIYTVCIALLFAYYTNIILAESSIEESSTQTSVELIWQETFAKRAYSEYSKPYFNLYEVLSEVRFDKTTYYYDYNEVFNRAAKKENETIIQNSKRRGNQ